MNLLTFFIATILLRPTFNSVSVSLEPSVDGTRLEYKSGRKWIAAPDLGGNIMGLEEDTEYKVRVCKDKKVLETASFRTWKTDVPVAKTIELDPATMDVPYTISEKGTEGGWIRYVLKGGEFLNTKGVTSFIIKDAEYVLLDGMTLRGPAEAKNVIVINDSRAVRVRACDIAEWGHRTRPDFTERVTKKDRYKAGNGRPVTSEGKVANMEGAIEIGRGSSEVVVERCYIHDPLPHTVSWYYCHPAGAEAIVMNCPDHSTVIRYNDFIGSDAHRFNDCVEGYRNFFADGGFNMDADIYGNFMIFANDDCIEIDGGQRNVRVFRNRFEGSYCGVSVQGCMVGPSVISKNLFSGMGEEFNKAGQTIKTDRRNGEGAKCYILGNTFWGRGSGVQMRQTLASTVKDNVFCGDQKLGGIGDCETSVAADNQFKADITLRDLDTACPCRELPFTLDCARIEAGMDRRPVYVKILGKLPEGTRVLRPAFSDWFDVELDGKSVKVSFNEEKMNRRRNYRGAFIVRTPNGMSRPVSVYADTDFIPPYKCGKPGQIAIYDDDFKIDGKQTAKATFNVEKAGRYWILVRGYAGKGDAIRAVHTRVSVDGGEMQFSKQFVYGYPGWSMLHPMSREQEKLMSYVRHFDFEPGEHTVEVKCEQGSAHFQGMVITDSPAEFEPNQEYDDSPEIFSIKDFGAKGDGVAIDSPAINAAIEAAAGKGGTVVIPEGTYNCFSIRLKSDVTIKFEKGAVVKAAQYTDSLGFDDAEPNGFEKYQDFGHSHFHNSLIWGDRIENVTLCGEGFIDGSLMSDGLTDRMESTDIALDFRLKKGVSNKALSLLECRNITVKDLTFYRCGHFCILATGVHGLTLENLSADSQRDGFDIDSCSDVVVKGCRVNTPWDDGIVLKASYALGEYRDCENVSISGCEISGYEVGSMLDGSKRTPDFSRRKNPNIRSCGRIKLGTESSGGFRNISVSDCRLEYSGGLHVETTDGGHIDNVSFRDITIDRCEDSPIFVMIGSRLRSPEGREVGTIHNVSFTNIVSTAAKPDYGVVVTGYRDHPVRDIRFENVSLESRGGLSPSDARENVIEMEKHYPDPKTFGVMPSKGMYLRHVEGVQLKDVTFSYIAVDSRPEMIAEDVSR